MAGFPVPVYPMWSCSGNNVCRLQPLGALFYFIGDRLTFAQGFETRALDRAEMYEDIIAAVALRNKAKTLGFIEPLYCT